MKLVFLCGSLEPGRDGVGDYTRRLAGELMCQGHQTAIVAVNDAHLSEELDGSQPCGAVQIPVLRLPAGWSERQRFSRAESWVNQFDPAWISLQFVPYAFHSKGLPLFLGKHLQNLIKGRRVHLMFHESWLGAGVGASVKRRLISALQKTVVGNILVSLQPTVLHTHLPTYRTQIEALGWQTRNLLLFSNIPLTEAAVSEADTGIFRVGIFSQADSSVPLVEFLAQLAEQIVRQGRQFQVMLIGGDAAKMRQLGATLEEVPSLQNRICYTGFLESHQLSEVLRTCSLGLTPVPRHALGKSGSVAAFLEHGIPVAAPNVHPEYEAADIGFFTPNLRAAILLDPDIQRFKTAQASARLAQGAIHISSVAQTFVEDLTCQ
ncbi:glycosyltransferase [Hymenobacter crusticola]|uniref:Glycosyltransferase subfamily 4-like N-terminal domain-containing protein n=1 Tax=Hymenobacter crusticola TaxID=1770526 RepID=A0A243W7Z4_9BACT|nr:glycosyltransferase [Hymenobacter crusticola]OUJ71197.1 hypothetical protein BXP70_22205 [Hymenobacter crusticola]